MVSRSTNVDSTINILGSLTNYKFLGPKKTKFGKKLTKLTMTQSLVYSFIVFSPLTKQVSHKINEKPGVQIYNFKTVDVPSHGFRLSASTTQRNSSMKYKVI